MLAKSHRPFQFRLRTALLVMSACCVAALPLGYFVRSLQRPQRQLVPVSGVVTLNGQPLADAHVQFISNDPRGRPAAGSTDTKGRFSLTTYFDPTRLIAGAQPGEYTVIIHKFISLPEPASGTPWKNSIGNIGAVDPADTERIPAAARNPSMPRRYSDPKTSGLRASVSEDGTNSLNFSLTWD